MQMLRWLLVVALAPLGTAVEMPSGIFRGKLAGLEGTSAAGEFNATDSTGAAYSCGYDARSYFELNRARVAATKLQTGDPLEVVADRKPGMGACYARIVHVVALLPSGRRIVEAPVRPPRVSEFLPQRGDRSFAGVVVQLEASRMTLKTRDGQRTLVLRPDTRFLGGGLRVNAAEVPRNTHVFVRAGRNVYGQIEAFQVVWGELVNAR
jgi:hypothetical protein